MRTCTGWRHSHSNLRFARSISFVPGVTPCSMATSTGLPYGCASSRVVADVSAPGEVEDGAEMGVVEASDDVGKVKFLRVGATSPGVGEGSVGVSGFSTGVTTFWRTVFVASDEFAAMNTSLVQARRQKLRGQSSNLICSCTSWNRQSWIWFVPSRSGNIFGAQTFSSQQPRVNAASHIRQRGCRLGMPCMARFNPRHVVLRRVCQG